jgi:hypothetical protein
MSLLDADIKIARGFITSKRRITARAAEGALNELHRGGSLRRELCCGDLLHELRSGSSMYELRFNESQHELRCGISLHELRYRG